MATDVFRGLARLVSGGLLLNTDPAATVDAEAPGADDPFTRGLPRDENGALLVAMATAKDKATVPALGATTTGDQIVCAAPFDGTVSAVSYTPEANVTGDNTNTRTLTLVNKGQDGNGTTVIATLALTTGVNLTDFNETAFTMSVVADATDVVEGDILAFVSTHAASGLADPGGLVQVKFARDLA